jgi:GntR family transcriptional regulator
MLIDLDPSDPRPVFRQIADEVQRSVALGILRPGDALPAVRELARDLKVNANTVQNAYRTLAAEGTAHVRRGLGTFVASAPKENKARQAALARRIAERMLREAFRHGLLASDLIAALHELRK